jgi:hypothetical protein
VLGSDANVHPDDAARVSNKLQSGLPGSGKEAKKQGEVWAAEAGSKLDQTVSHRHKTANFRAIADLCGRSPTPKPRAARPMPS